MPWRPATTLRRWGVEFLRNIYAASGLAIKPKTKVIKINPLKEIIRVGDMNPEQILTKDA